MIFVDTSAFYAAADRGDTHHARAVELLGAGDPLVATDHILLETWILLDAHLGRHAAQSFWAGVRGGAVDVATVGPADLDRAYAIAGDFPDQGYSIVDMTSFAVMERLSIARVASFDHHFAVHRHGPHRDRSFQVLA